MSSKLWGNQLVRIISKREAKGGVLFSRISRVRHRENFHFSLCAIYSNGHITKVAKLNPREVPDLVQNRGKI